MTIQTLRFLAAPTEVDEDGAVPAGIVLTWIDRAGYACAAAWSGSYCVTAYVGSVTFSQPISAGELIEVQARIVHTGRTSMNVLVTVAAGDPRTRDVRRRSECALVFVAVDAEGNPLPVPSWRPSSVSDLELALAMEERLAARATVKERMRSVETGPDVTAPATVLRFLAPPSDANFGGNVHGGSAMRWLDEAARVCVTGWAGRHAVAVYTGGIHFERPIRVGDLVEVEARLLLTTKRSAHVGIRMRSTAPTNEDWRLTTICTSVLVAVGREGRAEPMRPFVPASPADRRNAELAEGLSVVRSTLPPLIPGSLSRS